MASSSRLLLLRRGDHDSRLTEGFESLLDMESMCDVSITCGQYIIKAHRTVLSIFSPFFKRIFDSITNPMHYPFVVIKDMPYADLRAIIDLMYRGEVTVAQDQFGSLKKSAKTLEVSELSDIITSYEERMDTKPKINFDESGGSSGGGGVRNTRKRGRPKRYCEESDEEVKALQTPSKRQQIIGQSRQPFQTQLLQTKSNSKPQTLVKKSLMQKTQIRFVEDSYGVKPQTATRGGYSSTGRPPTAVRGGGHSFSRPQTATRGAHSVGLIKPQVATRGRGLITTRGRGRAVIHTPFRANESFITADNTNRRGRRGRPPRQSRDTPPAGLPLASSLPVSLPQQMDMDLENIFPNYNLNDAPSSTSSNNNDISIPITFEPTAIKREVDSDSEVECIMSGSSPLPSGVIDDSGDQSSYAAGESLQPIELPPNSELMADSNAETAIDINSESVAANSTADDSAVAIDFESSPFQSNIIIKTERNVSPIDESSCGPTNESNQDPNDRDTASHSENTETMVNTTVSDVRTVISTTSEIPQSHTIGTTVPIIRFIKTERISPPIVTGEAFQPISFTTDDTNDSSNEVTPTPIISSGEDIRVTTIGEEAAVQRRRIKIERISPVTYPPQEIDISNEIDQNADHSTVDTTKANEHVADNTADQAINSTEDADDEADQTEQNDIECVFSGSPVSSTRAVKIDIELHESSDDDGNADEAEAEAESANGNASNMMESYEPNQMSGAAESGDGDNVHNASDDNVIDVQDIAFECFFSNDDQPLQTYATEVSSTSMLIDADGVHNQAVMAGLNVGQQVHQQYETNQESEDTQERNSNIIYVDRNEEHSMITSYAIDNNSPIHSDEECMLLDSPQHAGFEVTVGSEPQSGDDFNDDI